MALHIIILGAGMTGLTSALALKKHLPSPKPRITVYEIRDAPSTIGGAVNLTPKALRYLDYLGVFDTLKSEDRGAECQSIELFDLYTGVKTCELDFRGPEGNGIGKERGKEYFARRVMRWELQKALIDAVKAQDDTEIVWGKQVTQIQEPDGKGVRLTFADGASVTADILLGCDGIHSMTRSLLVEPDRLPTYTGIAVAMNTSKVRPATKLRWHTTALASSRRGSFMTSYFEKTRTEQYIGVVMETAEVASREGWKARASDQTAIKADILDRFRCESMPELGELIEDAGDWTLYPVYALPPNGKWISPGRRCILLGDSAHAMPPQGESTGICIEDAIIFSRAMMQHDNKSLNAIFAAYESFRRPHVEAAVQQANQRWETVKDKGWLVHKLMMFITPWFLWWTAKSREQEFSEDHTELYFDFQE